MHRPPFSPFKYNPKRNLKPENRDQLVKLFAQYRVSAVFSSHDHCLYREEHQGVQYIVSAGAGAPLYKDHQNGGVFHYLLVKVKGDEMKITSHIPYEIYWENPDPNTILITNSLDKTVPLAGISLPDLKENSKLKIKSFRIPKTPHEFKIINKNNKFFIQTKLPATDTLEISLEK